MKTEKDIVQIFSGEMYKKIEERHNRYQPFAWRDMDLKRLIRLLEGELNELKEGFAGHDSAIISKEAIDIANYACFIWEMVKEDKVIHSTGVDNGIGTMIDSGKKNKND